MRHLFYICLSLLLLAGTATAQSDACDPRDTTNCILNLDIQGNPLSGYRLKGVNNPAFRDSMQFKVYQLDRRGNLGRQVIMTKYKWPNCPQDILDGGGGYRLAAVTEREYAALKKADMIWGEYFICMMQKPSQYDENKFDQLRELTVVPLAQSGFYYPHMNCLEIMFYTDDSGRDYMTAAKNIQIGRPDYTSCLTEGKYDCRLIGTTVEQEREWFGKTNNYYK